MTPQPTQAQIVPFTLLLVDLSFCAKLCGREWRDDDDDRTFCTLTPSPFPAGNFSLSSIADTFSCRSDAIKEANPTYMKMTSAEFMYQIMLSAEKIFFADQCH
jgi:hypothetical protein